MSSTLAEAIRRLDKAETAGDPAAFDKAARAVLDAERAVEPAPEPGAAGASLLATIHAHGDDPAGAIGDWVRGEGARHMAWLAPPALAPLADWRGMPAPAPVIWRDDPAAPELSSPDAVLSVGECAVLSAPGGLGKSYVTISLAKAAGTAHAHGKTYGATCGFRVKAGPVVIVNYEDSPVRIAERLERMGANDDVWNAVHVAQDPAPLFEADPDERGRMRRGPGWDPLWRVVRRLQPSLVVVDPASAALIDVSVSEGGPVRSFVRALAGEAQAGGFGVLIVAHDTKAGRNAAKDGGDPGADAIAGSAQWYDGARGVLYMRRDHARSGHRLIECVKANYGRAGWGARLAEDQGPGGALRSLKLADRLDPDAMVAAKGTSAKAPGDAGFDGNTGVDKDNQSAPGVDAGMAHV